MTQSEVRIEDLYRKHAPSVLRRARRLLGGEADAQEIVQEVFLSLYQEPGQYAGRSSLTTFLYSVTTHRCLNRIRNQKNRLRLLEQKVPVEEAGGGLSPEQRVQLHGALRAMPEELARVVIYHHVDDLTHQDISKILGCSRRQVGKLLQQATQWVAAREVCSV